MALHTLLSKVEHFGLPNQARACLSPGICGIVMKSMVYHVGLPKEARLRKRAEFLRVYEQGTRIEGRFMTVFILPNEMAMQRLGVTATKKGIGKAHDRVRVKRLLREAFRLSKPELVVVTVNYDWVINGRRGLLKVKLAEPLAEFRRIIAKVGQKENLLPRTEPKEHGEIQ